MFYMVANRSLLARKYVCSQLNEVNSALITVVIYTQSKCNEEYQFELFSKYDREHDFDVILG